MNKSKRIKLMWQEYKMNKILNEQDTTRKDTMDEKITIWTWNRNDYQLPDTQPDTQLNTQPDTQQIRLPNGYLNNEFPTDPFEDGYGAYGQLPAYRSLFDCICTHLFDSFACIHDTQSLQMLEKELYSVVCAARHVISTTRVRLKLKIFGRCHLNLQVPTTTTIAR